MIFQIADMNIAKKQNEMELAELLRALGLSQDCSASDLDSAINEKFGGNFSTLINDCFFVMARLENEYESELEKNNRTLTRQLEYIYMHGGLSRLYDIKDKTDAVISVFFSNIAMNIIDEIKNNSDSGRIIDLIYCILMSVKYGEKVTIKNPVKCINKNVSSVSGNRIVIIAGSIAIIGVLLLLFAKK